MITFITINGFGQDINVDNLLGKKETRTEIYNAILNNHELMQDFMNSAKGNQHAMMMMNQNNQMMNQKDDSEGNNEHQVMGQNQMMGKNKGNRMMGSANTNDNENDNSNMGYDKMMNQMMNNPNQMQGFMTNMMNTYGQDSTFVNNMAKIMASHPQLMKRAMHDYNKSSTMGK